MRFSAPRRGFWLQIGVSAVLSGAFLACERPAPSPDAAPPAARSSSSTRGIATAPVPATTASGSAAPVASAEPPKELRLKVRLVPIGKVPKATLEMAAKGLRDHAPVDPVIEQPEAAPPRARSPRKGAYQAHILIDWLGSLPYLKGGKVMGITEAEIVTRKGKRPIWGILGMGSIDGQCSVVSTYRMRRKWENGGAPEALVRERLWKIAIHELGHTLGLEHCPTVGCIMEDGRGTVKTVDRDKELCEDCAARYAESLRRNAEP